jgi:hypothetical protein
MYCMSGVDVIMHVASPLPDPSNPQAVLDVRGVRAQIQAYMLSNLQKTSFPGCRLRYHARPRCRPRRRREESRYHSKHSITRRTERFLERDNRQREM